jgi:hypothetical protein
MKCLRVFLILLFTLAALALAPGTEQARAESYQWIDIGGPPGVFEIVELAYDNTRDILYATCGQDGIWRCSNVHSAPTWTDLDPGDQLSACQLRGLAYDSKHNLLYTGDWQG